MSGTYHYNIPGLLIHIIHIILGAWLTYLGYNKITKESIHRYNYDVLLVLGIIVVLYFIHLLYEKWGEKKYYAFGVPEWLVHITHILNGLMFIMVGSKVLRINELVSLYLIVSGSLAALYHIHLMFTKH